MIIIWYLGMCLKQLKRSFMRRLNKSVRLINFIKSTMKRKMERGHHLLYSKKVCHCHKIASMSHPKIRIKLLNKCKGSSCLQVLLRTLRRTHCVSKKSENLWTKQLILFLSYSPKNLKEWRKLLWYSKIQLILNLWMKSLLLNTTWHRKKKRL